MTDHYSTLGVARGASPEDIKRAYRKMASKHHPDKGGDTATFQKIEEAYRVLSDPNQRQQYDNPQQQHQHFHFDFSGGNPDLNDIFAQFGFNPFGGRPGFQQQPRRNKDIRADVSIGLADTLYDQRRTLSIKGSENRKTVDINIPRGITSGTTMKYPNLGDSLFTNLPPGDLYITINVQPHPEFEAHGLDLIKTLTLDCFDAILGCERTVSGLDGKQFMIKIPAGCQPQTKLKITGEGLYGFQVDIKGSLYVKVDITIPRNLNETQVALIKNARDSK